MILLKENREGCGHVLLATPLSVLKTIFSDKEGRSEFRRKGEKVPEGLFFNQSHFLRSTSITLTRLNSIFRFNLLTKPVITNRVTIVDC